jgi:hypothetical protein
VASRYTQAHRPWQAAKHSPWEGLCFAACQAQCMQSVTCTREQRRIHKPQDTAVSPTGEIGRQTQPESARVQRAQGQGTTVQISLQRQHDVSNSAADASSWQHSVLCQQ